MIDEPPRALSAEERTLIGWHANSVAETRPGFARQVDEAEVVGHCECGCGSIFVRVNGYTASPQGPLGILAQSCCLEGRPFDVILWECDGFLAYLEIVSYDGAPIPIPEPSMMDVGDPFSA